MAYCFMKIDKIKSLGTLKVAYEHNFRKGFDENVDKSRSYLNEELIKMPEGQTYVDGFKRKMLEIGHIPRKNAVLALDIQLTYNQKDVGPDFDFEKWKELNVKWLKEHFPPDCILSAIVHRDEGPDAPTSGHIHAIVLPVHDEKLNCKYFTGGKAKMFSLQDSYGKAMAEVGLERGKKGSIATPEKIQRFYGAIDEIFSDCLPKKEEKETVEDYYERVNTIYQNKSLKHLSEIKKLQREIIELKTDIKMSGYDVKVGLKQDADAIKKAKEKAEKELKEIEEKRAELLKKEKELSNMDAKLRNYNLLLDGLENHPDITYTEEIQKNIKDIIDWERDYEKQIEANEKQEHGENKENETESVL